MRRRDASGRSRFSKVFAGPASKTMTVKLLLTPVLLTVVVSGSEFPERECCDSIPPLPAQFTTPPVSVGTISSAKTTSSPTAESEVVNLKTASTTINCKLARQMCVNDQACLSITTLIPRLCGQELVACSTVTVTKCRAALRTLVSFQFFQPTCLCKQPSVDPECNTYRSVVFDHPCFTVKRKDKDPYRVEALPTCRYALDACRNQGQCSRLYDEYTRSCSFEHKTCHMSDSSACYEAWVRLRMSPVFGCFCPSANDHDCQQIFNAVHRNPCIDALPQHQHQFSQHRTLYRLHRLINPPPSPRGPWRLPPTHRPPPRTRTSAAVSGTGTGTGASSRGALWPARHRVSVEVLAGETGRGQPPDLLLRTPLYDVTPSPGHGSTIGRTLFGPDRIQPTEVHGRPPPRYHVSMVPPAGGEDSVFRSSCHEARDDCIRDARCRRKLEPVLVACEPGTCDRGICMQRLQNFYSGADGNRSMEVAFCVCRRNSSGGEQCMQALRQLHPGCAQAPEGGVMPACHSVAQRCRGQPSGRCRRRLEQYEQACAVDSVTGRCAGPTQDCRMALLAVLGTQLRTRCACEGTDIASMHDCSGWERLLWRNQCVVQSQREFHHYRLSPGPAPAPAPPRRLPSPPRRPPGDVYAPLPATTAATPRYDAPAVSVGTTKERRTTTTTTARPTTLKRQPEAFCVLNEDGETRVRVPAGEGVRSYRVVGSERGNDVEDCSKLCMCHAHNALVCNMLDCVKRKPCVSSMATYHHGSSGLLPFREGCICYHGNFVCKQPPADQYTLPFGVFLFLGFSRIDETLLAPHTHRTVKDNTVQDLERLLQRLMLRRGEHFRDWPCKLSLRQYFAVSENIIIQAKLNGVEESYNQSLSQELLNVEKDECSRPLRDVSFMINNGDPAILSHPLLSVFKIAHVGVTIPTSSVARWPAAPGLLVAPLVAVLELLVR